MRFGQPSDILCPCGFAAWQCAKPIQVNRICSFLIQDTRLMKNFVSQLILGIVVDVLVHVAIKDLKRGGVEWTPGSSWDFAILDSSEFVILLPQISLKDSRAAARNLRIAASPGVRRPDFSSRPLLTARKADSQAARAPTTVAAPVARTPFFKNERRFAL